MRKTSILDEATHRLYHTQPMWLTSEEIRLLLRISDKTLAKWRDTGSLPYATTGSKCLYLNRDVRQLLLGTYNGPAASAMSIAGTLDEYATAAPEGHAKKGGLR